ncbi:MAG: hypothetical protein ACRDPM_00455 [Solirubrobacteraceae bacterium]
MHSCRSNSREGEPGYAGASRAACRSSTAKRTTAAHNRRVSPRFTLPRGCRRAKKVKFTVSWAGSSAFAKQTVTKTVAIAK